MTYRKKLIEVALPLDAIADSILREECRTTRSVGGIGQGNRPAKMSTWSVLGCLVAVHYT